MTEQNILEQSKSIKSYQFNFQKNNRQSLDPHPHLLACLWPMQPAHKLSPSLTFIPPFPTSHLNSLSSSLLLSPPRFSPSISQPPTDPSDGNSFVTPTLNGTGSGKLPALTYSTNSGRIPQKLAATPLFWCNNPPTHRSSDMSDRTAQIHTNQWTVRSYNGNILTRSHHHRLF